MKQLIRLIVICSGIFILFHSNSFADEYTILHLKGEGPNNGTQIVDSSTRNSQITLNGNVKISTNKAVGGNSSIYFDGNASFLSLADHSDWDFGTENFTIDAWVILDDLSSQRKIISQFNTGYNYLHMGFDHTMGLVFTINDPWGTSKVYLKENSVANWQTNTWYHVAVVRNGDTWSLYKDGVLLATQVYSGSYADVANPLMIGDMDYAGHYYWKGYIDELRVSRGIARWTQNFTPPLPKPEITFSIDNESIIYNSGETITLTWQTIDAVSCIINPGNISAAFNGSMELTPTAPTTYTLTATNSQNEITTSKVSVDVINGYDKGVQFTVDGKVGIKKFTPDHELDVNGTIAAREIIVTTDGWADYVFSKDYKLSNLNQVESFIEKNHHLPGIPSAKTLKEKGISVSQMLEMQMKKIEELTLYLIEQKKENQALKKRIEALEATH